MQQGDHIVLQEVQEVASSGVHCGLRDVCGSFFLVGQIQAAGGTCDLCEQRCVHSSALDSTYRRGTVTEFYKEYKLHSLNPHILL